VAKALTIRKANATIQKPEERPGAGAPDLRGALSAAIESQQPGGDQVRHQDFMPPSITTSTPVM